MIFKLKKQKPNDITSYLDYNIKYSLWNASTGKLVNLTAHRIIISLRQESLFCLYTFTEINFVH